MVALRAKPDLIGEAITSRTEKVDFGKYLHRKRLVIIATHFPNGSVSTLADRCVSLAGVKYRSIFGDLDRRIEE